MKIWKLNINTIDFIYTSYDINLLNSIKRIGCSFPIRVNEQPILSTTSLENSAIIYKVSDGNKRLSIYYDLAKEDSRYQYISATIINDGSIRTPNGWSNMNHH
ncbi:MAG: hypothetical protein RR646_00090 [Erysipelotrichaceae bacterium]